MHSYVCDQFTTQFFTTAGNEMTFFLLIFKTDCDIWENIFTPFLNSKTKIAFSYGLQMFQYSKKVIIGQLQAVKTMFCPFPSKRPKRCKIKLENHNPNRSYMSIASHFRSYRISESCSHWISLQNDANIVRYKHTHVRLNFIQNSESSWKGILWTFNLFRWQWYLFSLSYGCHHLMFLIAIR